MKKVAVIGAGISGLFIANLFKRTKKYQVTIFERNSLISLNDGYGIQLSVNSIKLLNKIQFDKLENNEKFNPDKINFYSVKNFNKICELNISDFNTENCKYTTLKRSSLINFLIKDLEKEIKFDHTISNIEQQDQIVKITFENNEIYKFDYLIISDGVFSKSKNLLSKNQIEPKFNDTLVIRGIIPSSSNMADKKNISLFLGPNFHYVIYPVSPNGDLNFIAVMKYNLTEDEKKDFSLFKDDNFITKTLEKAPYLNKEFFDNINDLKIYPVYVSNDFFEVNNNNIHLIGDAFFAYPPSFAQGASQSIEGAYELFQNIENNTESNFFRNRVNKTKMVNNRSKFNQFTFHLSNPLNIYVRNFFLKRLVKNKKFLESYLGKIYKN
ncbi:FAD-dependent monooxygenase [Candidatus Pelagibacter sp.]|nr:FAD-dependent monooxygenase [Candidatus Pelagibacter sp.]